MNMTRLFYRMLARLWLFAKRFRSLLIILLVIIVITITYALLPRPKKLTGSQSKSSKSNSELLKAAVADPNNNTALLALADSYYNAKNYPLAIERYNQAIRADTGSYQAYVGIGNSYRDRTGRIISGNDKDFIQQAESAYKKAISIYPSYAPAFIEYARLFIKQNKTDEAIKVLENGYKYNLDSKELKTMLDSLKKK